MNDARHGFDVLDGGLAGRPKAVFRRQDEAALAEAEANHRIANNLSIVAAYLRLQGAETAAKAQPIEPAAVRLILQEAAARIETVGRLHRHLASGPREPTIDIADYLDDLCRELARSMAFRGKLAFDRTARTPCTVSRDKAVPVALTVMEAITNAMKYAHPAGVPGRIDVSCQPGDDGGAEIRIADDGVGLPEGFDPRIDGGLGLKVMRSLVMQVGGRLAFESRGLGLDVRFTVPGEP